MKVEIDIPDDWYRAPSGWDEDVVWVDGPNGEPQQLTGQGLNADPWARPEVIELIERAVPLRCHSHKRTPGYIPCGNTCPFDPATVCPVPPITKEIR